MKNKKGQDLSIGTLILIVLGIIVLVILILGFSLGWGSLWEKINIFSGGSSIGEVVTACNLAGTQSNKYGYCQDFKTVKIDGKTEYLNCQDSRIQSSLEGERITCENNVRDSAKWYCLELGNDRQIKDTTEVNGFNCKTDLTVKNIPDGASPIDNPYTPAPAA